MVDYFASKEAFQKNVDMEFEEIMKDRILKWGQCLKILESFLQAQVYAIK